MAPLRVIRVIRIDGPLGPRGLEELAALWTEVCGGIFAIGHTFGVKVQKVQKVQRVQRVVDSRFAAMLTKSALRN